MKNTVPVYKIGQHCLDEEIHRYFKITDFDTKACTAAEFEGHHRHEYYELLWLRKGAGIHHIDGKEYPYSGGSMFLLSPGQVHSLTQDEKAEGYVLRFLPGIFSDARDTEEFLFNSCLFDNIDAFPAIPVRQPEAALLENLFALMFTELRTSGHGKELVLSSYLKILLTHILRIRQQIHCTATPAAEAGYELFRKYKIEIEKNFRQRHSVHEYAEAMHTQARTLNTIARKYANRSAGQLIADRIMLEAKRYLHHQALSMKEIAYALGFEDPAYFNRFFRKQAGAAPKQYKLQEME